MVARIRSGKSLKGAVNYNEHKVKEGKAELLLAKGYSKDAGQLKFNDKVNRLQKLADLNTRAATHCLHVSLNFDMSENLRKEKLQDIAIDYMDKIGFGRQPFLVYEHRDAAHQHVHIVTTNIQKDGRRISLHNLGRVQSENARKEIEIKFNLVKAGDRQNKLQPTRAIQLEKVRYGKSETKRAISNIVTAVVGQYKFASLPELNAVLKQYNVIADRGGENTRMFEKRGLQYSVLDPQGNKVGVPVKASSLYGRPVLSNLENKYESNKEARLPFKQSLKNKIDEVLNKKLTKESFERELNNKAVSVVFRTNEQNFMYGITYVDHQTKSVFNGSELGKEYSAASVLERLQKERQPVPQENENVGTNVHGKTQNNDLLNIFPQPSNTFHYLPFELRRRKRKKRR